MQEDHIKGAEENADTRTEVKEEEVASMQKKSEHLDGTQVSEPEEDRNC